MNCTRDFTIAIDLSKELPGVEPPPPQFAVNGVVLYRYIVEPEGDSVLLTALAAYGVNLMKMLSEEQINWLEDYLKESHGRSKTLVT